MNQHIITLDYGSGGKKTSQLIEEVFLPAFHNDALASLGDGAVMDLSGPVAFSTDSFVVSPLFFPGGDIGKLSVCGTVNDLAMCGAIPRCLSLAFIIEEGLPVEHLRQIVASVAQTARSVGVQIVTGDTKVVERGRGDGLYINTAGIGTLVCPDLRPDSIRPGDAVIVSGTIGDHGAAIMMSRNGLLEENSLVSDCRPLHKLAQTAWSLEGLRVLRDPTRGGVATTLNEFVEGRDFSIELDEDLLPVKPSVQSACDLLGLDPLYCANEGKMLAVCSHETADERVAALRSVPGGEDSRVIGHVSSRMAGKVILHTYLGGSRVLSKLTGAQLPRIC